MADIKNYMNEKKKREQKNRAQNDRDQVKRNRSSVEQQRKEQNAIGYKQKIARHRLTAFYRILILLAVLAALAVLVVVQYKRHIYTSYDTVSSIEKERGEGMSELRLGDSFLSYSKDGAHCTDAKGEVKWNQTFGIQDVNLSLCGDTVAIGEYNGRSIYVANSEQLLGEITTTMPIRDLAVSESGMVTAVLADTDVAWINTYNNKGELIYKGQANMDDSGYPAAISLSPDGELLCVSYIYVDAGVLKTNVAFYNFGAMGSNYPDHLVSVHIYTDMVVPFVKFMNDDTAFAVGDSRLMIFSGSHKPVSQAEYLFDEEVKSVFYNDEYIGLVFLSDNNENRYMMKVYDLSAAEVGKYYFDMEYTDIFFGRDSFTIYNESACRIVTLDGLEKFNGSFSKNVRLMLPVGNTYKYILVTDSSIDTIQLK